MINSAPFYQKDLIPLESYYSFVHIKFHTLQLLPFVTIIPTVPKPGFPRFNTAHLNLVVKI